jgi:Uncharacterised MFS-type transporter YbfB
MVVTMVGLQEARAQAPGNPTVILGRMTAAFATGQLAGPLIAAALDLLPVGHVEALAHALQLAAFGLTASAAALWALSISPHAEGNEPMPPVEFRHTGSQARAAAPDSMYDAASAGTGRCVSAERMQASATENRHESQRRDAQGR